jgi:uncharacterized circularly permuted ATP-grasp superfamily protein
MFLEDDRTLPSTAKQQYQPHVGFIGEQPLKVPNYLFHSSGAVSAKNAENSDQTPYSHCQPIADLILNRPIEEQQKKSELLTEFLRKREMTFSKLTQSGEYKIFTVPCTTTPLALPKSLFDSIELSAQVLVASLRLVLQDLYGSQSVRKSTFASSLPESVRNSFISTIEKSPQYFPQLHHPVMKEYPFFDVVGLDLVLVEDYSDSLSKRPRLVARELPFRLLEINAGSPSGASNNRHILEGLAQIDPEILHAAGKVIPNDHFEVLAATYRSIGESWTGVKDGVQVLLPPGGGSGAAPEIHQLAARSGIVYSDAGQLYRGADGYLRLRTATSKDPIVTAIYSRVNSDSALFDLARGITLRDAETGKPLYAMDSLGVEKGKKPQPLLDRTGNPVPQESVYAIPSAVSAIHERKTYVGGLNRVLDNKIILSTLCEYAPTIFKAELEKMGFQLDRVMPLTPPQTLPSSAEAIKVIQENPEDWVIKAPDLSGGKGVYILKTLPPEERKKILQKAAANPKYYAYQKLVRIGRLPIAHRTLEGTYRYQNIAADLRMWSFYGAGGEFPKPRLTHNGLIRTAPQEKGPLSSIVNTSMGGGYAPFLVIDDVGSPNAVDAKGLLAPGPTVKTPCDLPAFVAAQLLQIAQIQSVLREKIQKAQATSRGADLSSVYFDLLSLRNQCREVLSYLHPDNMQPLNEAIDPLEECFKKSIKQKLKKFALQKTQARAQIVLLLREAEKQYPTAFTPATVASLEAIQALVESEIHWPNRKDEDRVQDAKHADLVVETLEGAGIRTEVTEKLKTAFAKLIPLRYPEKRLTAVQAQELIFQLEVFRVRAKEHLSKRGGADWAAEWFESYEGFSDYRILFESAEPQLVKNVRIASEVENATRESLQESQWVRPEVRIARRDWLAILSQARALAPSERRTFMKVAREDHLEKYPWVRRLQTIIDGTCEEPLTTVQAVLELLEVLPFAKFAVSRFAEEVGCTLQDLFVSSLQPNRIALLTHEERLALGLPDSDFVGECFAKKRSKHGLLSDSDVFTWIDRDSNPLILGYTLGHELIHRRQMLHLFRRESRALTQNDPEDFARFINFYSNFLGVGSGVVEGSQAQISLTRKPVYGVGSLVGIPGENWINEARVALKKGETEWNEFVSSYGGWLALSTEPTAAVRARALRELIPAFENARNLVFAQEVGLEVPVDPVQSAMPAANEEQVERYRQVVLAGVDAGFSKIGPELSEALRIIASHQYLGVRFSKAEVTAQSVRLKSTVQTVSIGESYNQSQ